MPGSRRVCAGFGNDRESETLLVTGVSTSGSGKTLTTTLTFTRGYLGTTAAAHAANKAILRGTAASADPQVTLATGTYISAGGGFRVCGLASLSAPNVLIYDTKDPTTTTGYGAFDQVLLNTNGNVSLGPQVVGAVES